MDDPTETYPTWREALAALVERMDLLDSDLGRISGEITALRELRQEIYRDMKKRGPQIRSNGPR